MMAIPPNHIMLQSMIQRASREARRIKPDAIPARFQDAAAFGARLRELRWKNSAWLATADTIAG